jgi:hypothetical protein
LGFPRGYREALFDQKAKILKQMTRRNDANYVPMLIELFAKVIEEEPARVREGTW